MVNPAPAMARPQPTPDAPDGPTPPRVTAVRRARRRSPALTRERARVAEALHNTICQELTGIGLMASAAARQHHATCPEAEQQFRELADLIQRSGAGLRDFVRTLRPPD